MNHFSHDLAEERSVQLGLIVLQSDETIEPDFRRLLPSEVELLVSRVPSGAEVSASSLRAMETQLSTAASLFPQGARFGAVGYGCTSGTSQIGPERVAQLVGTALGPGQVTNPLSALINACRSLKVRRLALLSPYVPEVSERLREVLMSNGLEVPTIGSFDVAEEARVVRISKASIIAAGEALSERADVDALFLSCTNLRTLDVIEPLERKIGLPVLSSNLVLAWDMLRLADVARGVDAPGCRLARDRGAAPGPGIFAGQ